MLVSWCLAVRFLGTRFVSLILRFLPFLFLSNVCSLCISKRLPTLVRIFFNILYCQNLLQLIHFFSIRFYEHHNVSKKIRNNLLVLYFHSAYFRLGRFTIVFLHLDQNTLRRISIILDTNWLYFKLHQSAIKINIHHPR